MPIYDQCFISAITRITHSFLTFFEKSASQCPKALSSFIVYVSEVENPRLNLNKQNIMSKKNYLCIQRSQAGDCEMPSPSEMEEMYAKFHTWKEKFDHNIVDLGGRLAGGSVVNSKGATDGPFMESKEIVGGFMIISAESLEEAIQVARECPGVVSPGSSVEVREIQTP